VATSGDSQLVVRGQLAGRTVQATWWRGTVVGDALLITAAQMVVAGGVRLEDDGTIVQATFATMRGAILAFTRALEKIDAVQISPPSESIPL